jgi:hypothetical protein
VFRSIPVASCAKLVEEQLDGLTSPGGSGPSTTSSQQNSCLQILTRDYRRFRFVFSGAGDGFVAHLVDFLSRGAFPSAAQSLFAYSFHCDSQVRRVPHTSILVEQGTDGVYVQPNGWDLFDVVREFRRQGVLYESDNAR